VVDLAGVSSPDPSELAAAPSGPSERTARQRKEKRALIPWCGPIDGYRAICASLAVAGHTFLASSLYPYSGALLVLGILVALFFAISGYVLYQPFIEADVWREKRPDAGQFYIRRLLRIYPLFALALTAYLVILPEVRPDNAWAYVRLYLFLQIFGRELTSSLKGLPSAWYLCNEVIFYLLMPILAMAAARISRRQRRREPAERLRVHLWIGWSMVVIGPLSRTLLFALKVPAATFLPLSHLEFFGFGVVTAAYAVGQRAGIDLPSPIRWLKDHVSVSYALLLVPIAGLAITYAVMGDGSGKWAEGDGLDQVRFLFYLPAIVLLMTPAALGSPSASANRWLSSDRFKPLSALALHVYLWHQLVLGIMNRWFGGLDKVDLGPRVVTGTALVASALGGAYLVAWLSQPSTDLPYERYRAAIGRSRNRPARAATDRRRQPPDTSPAPAPAR
jgi:peptidoglycan/LPS O-acetylase OafA/YrhL